MHENTLGGQFVGPGQISRKKWAQEKETMPATRRTWPCCPSNWEIKWWLVTMLQIFSKCEDKVHTLWISKNLPTTQILCEIDFDIFGYLGIFIGILWNFALFET